MRLSVILLLLLPKRDGGGVAMVRQGAPMHRVSQPVVLVEGCLSPKGARLRYSGRRWYLMRRMGGRRRRFAQKHADGSTERGAHFKVVVAFASADRHIG